MLKIIEKALLLQEMDVLRFVSADHLIQLAELCQEEAYKKGDIIAQHEDAPSTIYLLMRGRAASESKNEVVYENAALNLCSSLAGLPFTDSCICLEDCTVLAIAAADLTDLLAGDSELCLALLKYFVAKHMDDFDGLT